MSDESRSTPESSQAHMTLVEALRYHASLMTAPEVAPKVRALLNDASTVMWAAAEALSTESEIATIKAPRVAPCELCGCGEPGVYCAPPSAGVASSLPPLGSTASLPESDAEAKRFLDGLLQRPGDTVTLAEVHRLLWLALAYQERATKPQSAREPINFLPRGWSLARRDDGIVVSHKDEGSVFVRETNERSIAELLLFYLADDLMDPALWASRNSVGPTGVKP